MTPRRQRLQGNVRRGNGKGSRLQAVIAIRGKLARPKTFRLPFCDGGSLVPSVASSGKGVLMGRREACEERKPAPALASVPNGQPQAMPVR